MRTVCKMSLVSICQTEINSVFKRKSVYAAFLAMLFCFNGYSIPRWIIVSEWEFAYRETALQLSIGAIFFGGVMLLMPFLSSLPTGPNQIEELRTRFSDMYIIRGGIYRYATSKLLAAFISGSFVSGGAFAVHAILWNLIATPCDVNEYEYLVIGFSDVCIFDKWQFVACGLPIFMWITIAIGFTGGCWSIVGNTIALFVNDKLMTLIIPACIYYLWMSGLPHLVFGREFPFPASLYNDGLTWPLVIKSVTVYLLMLTICVTLYLQKLGWKYHEK